MAAVAAQRVVFLGGGWGTSYKLSFTLCVLGGTGSVGRWQQLEHAGWWVGCSQEVAALWDGDSACDAATVMHEGWTNGTCVNQKQPSGGGVSRTNAEHWCALKAVSQMQNSVPELFQSPQPYSLTGHLPERSGEKGVTGRGGQPRGYAPKERTREAQARRSQSFTTLSTNCSRCLSWIGPSCDLGRRVTEC